jgi:5-methylthioadenosine/S-adenosylhomocysteine deaminase
MSKKLLASFFILFLILLGSRDVAYTQPLNRNIDLLVIGGLIVTMDRLNPIVEDGAIAINNGRILDIGSRKELTKRYRSRQIIYARNKAVIPGLINGHTHVPMVLFRGIADDLELNEWLTKYIFPAEAKNVTEEFVRVGTQLGLAEMIRNGITTYCDMYYFEDAIAEETSKAGVRALLGETVIDFPVADNKSPADALAYTERFIKRWQGHKLIIPAIAPHAPYTVSEENLKAVRALSDRMKAPILIHLSETRKEVEDILKSKGRRPVEYLYHIGFLNDRLVAAHVIHANKEEIDILKRVGVGVVHNPQSNMKLASGVAPVPQMLEVDMALGLGTDSAASNNDLDMWGEMDMAAKLHKVSNLDPRLVSARQAFEMATIRGARALHMEQEIGSIEVNKRADIVIVDLDNLHQLPRYNIYSQLVYSTKGSDVNTVIIEGKVIMRNRKLMTLDERLIKSRAEEFKRRILKSLGKE